MKPCRELVRSDLERSPVWVWRDEGDAAAGDPEVDESFVLPTALERLPLQAFAQFVVACRITLKDKSVHPGFAEVTVAEGKVAVVPTVVFLLDRQLTLPAVETNRLLSRYTRTPGNFPVSWELAVLAGEETRPRRGRIRGGDMKRLLAVGRDVLLSLKALRK